MIELLREPDTATMGLLRSILESRGIPTSIRHEREYDVLGSSRFDLPKYWPALGILREEDHATALAILAEAATVDEARSAEEIPCPACGESNPGNFEICWDCGAGISPDSEDPDPRK
jgi:hypothetical protein